MQLVLVNKTQLQMNNESSSQSIYFSKLEVQLVSANSLTHVKECWKQGFATVFTVVVLQGSSHS